MGRESERCEIMLIPLPKHVAAIRNAKHLSTNELYSERIRKAVDYYLQELINDYSFDDRYAKRKDGDNE